MPAAAGRPCRPTTTTAATGRGRHHGASGGNALAESLQFSVQSTHGVSSTPSDIRPKVHRINWISYCDSDICGPLETRLVTRLSLAYHHAVHSRGIHMAERKVRVAIAQAAPVFLDLDRSLEKAVRLIEEAARKGARLVAFGETWLPGYPAWLDLCPGAARWDHPPAKKAYARLLENSVAIPGPETERLAEAARAHAMVVVIGVHERVPMGPGHGTLYNTQIVFGADGAILSRHRKLVPTHAERLVWGQGDGGGLAAVPTVVGRV